MFSKLCRSMEMAPTYAKRARRTASPGQTKQAPGQQRRNERLFCFIAFFASCACAEAVEAPLADGLRLTARRAEEKDFIMRHDTKASQARGGRGERGEGSMRGNRTRVVARV
jgi:hypothetical protein